MFRIGLCGGLAAAVLAASAGSAASQTGIEQQRLLEIRAATPPCDLNPTFPIRGRVSGILGNGRGASFVGCFPTIESCERWRSPVSGQMQGRLILSRCDLR